MIGGIGISLQHLQPTRVWQVKGSLQDVGVKRRLRIFETPPTTQIFLFYIPARLWGRPGTTAQGLTNIPLCGINFE